MAKERCRHRQSLTTEQGAVGASHSSYTAGKYLQNAMHDAICHGVSGFGCAELGLNWLNIQNDSISFVTFPGLQDSIPQLPCTILPGPTGSGSDLRALQEESSRFQAKFKGLPAPFAAARRRKRGKGRVEGIILYGDHWTKINDWLLWIHEYYIYGWYN